MTQIDDAAQEFDAARRRDALRSALTLRNLSVADAAKAAGLKSASALGNFLNGHTNSLNLTTLEPLARHLQMSLNQLVGEPEPPRINGKDAYIRGDIGTDHWTESYCWPPEKWIAMTIPSDEHLPDYGPSYFLRLNGREMDEVYRPGTILQVVEISDFTGSLQPGLRVIVMRTNVHGYIEVSCREIVADGTSCQIITRSTDPQLRDRVVPIRWPIQPTNIETAPNGDKFEIKAVVIRSMREEI